MVSDSSGFVIKRIWWERVFLNMEIMPGADEKRPACFFLRSDKGVLVPVGSGRKEDSYIITINITCVRDRSFLDNGRWYLVTGQEIEDRTEYRTCRITAEAAYMVEDLSRIFKYAENQMAYNISFGAYSDDDCNIELYIDSYFMQENKHWKRRRYIREVRKPKEKVKRFFMFASIVLIRVYYHLLYAVTPKHGDRIMMMSETKEALTGNLKAIDDRIKERGLDGKFKLTYSCRNAAGKHQGFSDIAGWIKVVTMMARQDVIFVDDYVPVLGFFDPGKKTKIIQVWHAGEGFKSVGYSRFGREGSPFPEGSCHRKYTHVITGSEHLTEVFHEVFAIEKDAFYPFGMPRLDGFLDKDRIERFKAWFYEKYPGLKGKKIILFAPTYRGAEQKEAYYDMGKIDLLRIDKFCRDNGYVFLIKMHPFIKEACDIPEDCWSEIYDFSSYPDINELYYITDILITDYSSNYFEYAQLKRPVIFYTYDREIYELTRGVHRSIKGSAPGKVCGSFDELMECLESGDFEQEKIEDFAEKNFTDSDSRSVDRIIDEILLAKGDTDE